MGENSHKFRKQQRRGSKKKLPIVKQKNRKTINLVTEASNTFYNTTVN